MIHLPGDYLSNVPFLTKNVLANGTPLAKIPSKSDDKTPENQGQL